MQELGIDFTVVEPQSDESSNDLNPGERAIQNAKAKAASVSKNLPDSLIIGADTIVFLDGEFLGKPENQEDAKRMLGLLSGRTHQVITGVAFLDTSSGELLTDYEETLVRFHELDQSAIEDYVESGEPMDKAGAYAIQGGGAAFIDEYVGSWSNIVGLPLEKLRELLKKKCDH